MTSENPFATPGPSQQTPKGPTDWFGRLLPNAKAIFLRWEYWRLIYCAICVAATIAFMFIFENFPRYILPTATPLSSWAEYVVAGMIANCCYFAGPVVNTYVDWLGVKSRWFGVTLLGVGTAFTVFAAFLAVSGNLN